MMDILEKINNLNKQQVLIFLDLLEKDIKNYKRSLYIVKFTLSFVFVLLVLGLSYAVFTYRNVYLITSLSVGVIIMLIPMYSINYKLNKLNLIVEYLNMFKHKLYATEEEDMVRFNINKIIIYLSRQFTINRYMLINAIKSKNVDEVIKMVKMV